MRYLAITVSLGICTHNDHKTIRRLLFQCYHVANQYLRKDLDIVIKEVIVVSSGSLDGTNDILQQMKQIYNGQPNYLPIIQKERRGKTDAVNTILSTFSSDLLVLIPADVSINFCSIHQLTTHIISSPQIGVVSGSPCPNLKGVSSTLVRRLVKFIWKLHHETLLEMSKTKLNSHSSGELMILRREVAYPIPVDIINDDAYLALRGKKSGYHISYEPKANVVIEVPSTIHDYILQRRRVLLGHKQLQYRVLQHQNNFRRLFRMKPLQALKILRNTITNYNSLIGFLISVVVEIRIEIGIKLSGRSNHDFSAKNIWRRINQHAI